MSQALTEDTLLNDFELLRKRTDVLEAYIRSIPSQDDDVQQGVVGATDGLVTFASASSVNVAAGSGWISVSGGLLRTTWVGSILSGITVSTGTRLDQICINTNGVPVLVSGTEQGAGVATLTNRTGAASVPANTLRLNDLLITTAGVVNNVANIRDRRPWARGAFTRLIRTAGDITTVSGTIVALDSTNLAPRIECSGAPLRVTLRGLTFHSVVGTNANSFFVRIDGTVADSATQPHARVILLTNVFSSTIGLGYEVTPTVGSHVIDIGWFTSAATATVAASAASPLVMVVEEIVRQNANNGV